MLQKDFWKQISVLDAKERSYWCGKEPWQRFPTAEYVDRKSVKHGSGGASIGRKEYGIVGKGSGLPLLPLQFLILPSALEQFQLLPKDHLLTYLTTTAQRKELCSLL